MSGAIIEIDSGFLSVAEAAALAGETVSVAHYAIMRGLLRARRVGGRYLIHRSDVQAFVEARARAKDPELRRLDRPISRTPRL